MKCYFYFSRRSEGKEDTLLGLGERKFTIDTWQASAKAGQEMRNKGIKTLAMVILLSHPPAREGKERGQATALKVCSWALYQFEEYKTEKKNDKKIDGVVLAAENKMLKRYRTAAGMG